MALELKTRGSGTTHITPVGGNVFLDLGFPSDEAAALKAESHRIITEKVATQSRQLAAKHLAETDAMDGTVGDGLGQSEQGE